MKNKILDELMHTDGFVSGEALSELCGISRTAIWKYIKALQQEGYQIESLHGSGYRLSGQADVLNEREILAALEQRGCWAQPQVYCYAEVTSTNTVARELADKAEQKNGIIVTAEIQTAGKGRLGRPWMSAAGKGLWCSVCVAPEMALAEASRFSFIAAVAVAEGIRKICGLPVEVKWPNDIVYHGRKLCGILIEMVAEAESVDYFVAGFGVNVNHVTADFPEEIRSKATSLYQETGEKINRAELLNSILYAINENIDVYKIQGFTPIRKKWSQYACLLGENVTIMNHNKNIYEGEMIGIDDDGALLLKAANGELKRVLAGDVSLRRAKGEYC